MKREIINHGSISQYTALGKGGPFYANAQAFIDAIDNNVKLPGKVKNISRYLARPNVHQESNTIDWIIPFDSLNPNEQYEVIPWSQASNLEKQNAKAELQAFTRALKKYGSELKRRNDPSSSSSLLASYLLGDNDAQELPAIHFPNEDCVFIVDGIPVITFWGFSTEERVPLRSPLERLNTFNAHSSNMNSGFNNNFNDANFSSIPPQQPPYQNEAAPNNEPERQERKHSCFLPTWLIWLLLLLLLIPLLLWLLWKFFGLFAGLFGALFGAPNVPAAAPNPPAIEAPAENIPPEAPVDPVVEVPSEPSAPSDPMDLNVPLPDIALPNINLEGGSISGGNLTTTPGSSGADQGIAPTGSADQGVAATGSADQGITPTGSADQGIAPTGGADQGVTPTGGADQGVAPTGGTDQGVAPSNGNQNAPVIPPDIMANNNLTQAQKEAIAAARAAENQSAIDAARAVENKAQSNGQVAPPELAKPGLSQTNGNVAQKGVKLFDGNWQTKSPLMDSANGRPLQMSYNFKDGQGQVTVTRSDGSKCVSPSVANVVNKGLEITNSGRATCPDNTTYQLPKVRCIDQGNSMVKCSGEVGAQRFPITFHQN